MIAITGHDRDQYAWTEEDIEIFFSIIRDLGNCCDIRFKEAEKCGCMQAEMRASRGEDRTRNNARLSIRDGEEKRRQFEGSNIGSKPAKV